MQEKILMAPTRTWGSNTDTLGKCVCGVSGTCLGFFQRDQVTTRYPRESNSAVGPCRNHRGVTSGVSLRSGDEKMSNEWKTGTCTERLQGHPSRGESSSRD
jgi:hypothetical protein